MAKKPTKAERKAIDKLVGEYKNRSRELTSFLGQLQAVLINKENELAPLVHSFRWRLKDPQSLRDKLFRKLADAKKEGQVFDLTKDDLFVRINDLVGVRILHLYTRQVASIDKAIKGLLDGAGLNISEGPFARTWDDETKEYFAKIGIETRESGASMYTSIHYIVSSNSKTLYTAELQVRTLAEELWGEVTHIVDYPKPSRCAACREQIKVLARVASSCSRLVDAIFHTHNAFKSSIAASQKRAAGRRARSKKRRRLD